VEVGDGDLVRLAREGDAAAFRLLVERHRGSARARAVRLGSSADDVDDIVQETFLQAFVALDRLREPDRFGAWLAGIMRNVQRAAGRRAPVLLLGDWPEGLHPASADGLPSAEDLDRAEALRAAVAALSDGQRRAVEQCYYADQPVGAARASLHKARRRLREHISASRPDLIPAAARRIPMVIVRIAHVRPELDTRLDGSTAIGHILVVLSDEPGRRAMGLWLRTREGLPLWRAVGLPSRDGELSQVAGEAGAAGEEFWLREFTAEELAIRLLGAVGGRVTGVDIDELGPGVLAARVGVIGPTGDAQVTARPGSALALAAALGAPIRVADALMDRLAVPVAGEDLLGAFERRAPVRPHGPRAAPTNLAFADGLDGWRVGGSSRKEVTGSHWDDYAVAVADGVATLAATVPEPYGDVFLGQEFLADDYRGAVVTLRAEVRAQDVAAAELSLDIVSADPALVPGPRTNRAVHRDGRTITGSLDWTPYEISARVPADAEHMGVELTLVGAGRVELRGVQITADTGPAG
jgi:RNA polymerase sigma factor (sigma-70 family)